MSRVKLQKNLNTFKFDGKNFMLLNITSFLAHGNPVHPGGTVHVPQSHK